MKVETNFFTGHARILTQETPMDVVREIACQPGQEDAFYILNVGDIVQKIKMWRLKMPRVKPFYAVKCNNNATVLELLAALGTGFDCASKAEMQQVLDLGVDTSRMIYAHPCKPISHLLQAAKLGVQRMTFDNAAELHKIKAVYPEAQLVLRIRCDAEKTQCNLGVKFGVLPEDARTLLVTARELELDIVGVAFHVGSGCQDPPVFLRAISAARQVFNQAISLGFNPHLLDIGGGFPGNSSTTLDELASYINCALEEHFPEDSGVQVIAEPGRYVVASAFTLATSVVAKRDVCDDNGSLLSTMYYINDGVYGSFNCTLFDHQIVYPNLLHDPELGVEHMPCSIWGPTCDGLDQVVQDARLPRLAIGDWLVWNDMGAYTIASAGTFNGFPLPKTNVVVPYHTWLYLEEHLGLSFGSSVGGGNNNTTEDCFQFSPLAFPMGFLPCGIVAQESQPIEDQVAQITLVDIESCRNR